MRLKGWIVYMTQTQRLLLVGTVVACFTLSGFGQQILEIAGSSTTAGTSPSSTATTGFDERQPRYAITAGDIFDVNFEFSPELNQTIAVQPDGFVTLREVGEVYVEGKTIGEVTEAIRAKYSTILQDPSISIVLRDFDKPYFVVGGEVKSPGKFELRGTITVAQAIALAGGFTDAAKHSHVLVFHRQTDAGLGVKTLNVKRMINDADLAEDIDLHPGDMVYVPQNFLSKVKGFVIPRATVGPTIRPKP